MIKTNKNKFSKKKLNIDPIKLIDYTWILFNIFMIFRFIISSQYYFLIFPAVVLLFNIFIYKYYLKHQFLFYFPIMIFLKIYVEIIYFSFTGHFKNIEIIN